MDANDIIEELKSRVQRQYILFGVLILTICVAVWFSWPKDDSAIYKKQIKELTAQVSVKEKDSLAKLKVKDATIKDLNARITVEKTRYAVIAKKYQELIDAQKTIVPAKTELEMRSRFSAAGYDPLPADQSPAGYICFSSR
jgi:hypothetical protein